GQAGCRRGRSDTIVADDLPFLHWVVPLGHGTVHPEKTKCREAQAPLLEARQDLEGDAALERVGFQDNEGALCAHDAITAGRSSATGGVMAASDARGPIAARYASSGRRYSRATRWMSAGVTPPMLASPSSTDRTRPGK